MSRLSVEEVDASLYALGIGTDARGTRVLIIGHSASPITSMIEARLSSFGARLFWAHDTLSDPELMVDYVVAVPAENAVWNIVTVAGNVLRPGGRYLVLIDELGEESRSVMLSDVQALGVSAVRILGCKVRREGIDQ
jgi:hypothetical protein